MEKFTSVHVQYIFAHKIKCREEYVTRQLGRPETKPHLK